MGAIDSFFMADKVKSNGLVRGRNPFLEFAVLCAMGAAALAFAVGLYLSANVGLVASLIVGIALFLVMAASQSALSRAHRFSEIVDRIEELQGSIMRFNDDVDRIDRFAVKCKQFDDALKRVSEFDALSQACERIGPLAQRVGAVERLAEKCERIDPLAERVAALGRVAEQCERIDPLAARVAALDQLAETSRQIGPLTEQVRALQESLGPLAHLDVAALSENTALVQRLSASTERLDARLEALRKQVQIEGRDRQDRLKAELQVLEALVQQLAEQIAAGAAAVAPTAAPAVAPPMPAPRASLAEQALAEAAVPEPVPDEAPDWTDGDAPLLDGAALDSLMEDRIRHAIETDKVDLFLQPIVGLPQRRPRYYEALTRLRNEAGDLILPKDYIPVAEAAGIMPLVDNLMLFRSVQVLRRLSERSNAKGLFCNISVHSLLDPEFFSELTSFMEQNRELADSLFFEFRQDVIKGCGPIERESLATLAALGFRFSLDHVGDLDVEFQSLHELGFRFVKIDAEIFLHGMAEAGARIHQADMRSYLERFGMDLIVEKIEDERSLTDVLDNDVGLGQGFLFSEPRPVRPEVFSGSNAAEAA